MAAGVREAVGHEYTCFIGGGEDARLHERFSVVQSGRPGKDAVAEVVGDLQGTSTIAVARQFGGRRRHGNGETFWARGYAVSIVGLEEEHIRRSSRNQEQRDAPGRDEDGDFSESLRTCIWQPLGLLTTVKPPALRERHDSSLNKCSRSLMPNWKRLQSQRFMR